MLLRDIPWVRYLFLRHGYFRIFIAGLAAALSIIVPVLSTTVVVFARAGFVVGASWVFEPPLIALTATISATIGQSRGYVLSSSRRRAMIGSYKKNKTEVRFV